VPSGRESWTRYKSVYHCTLLEVNTILSSVLLLAGQNDFQEPIIKRPVKLKALTSLAPKLLRRDRAAGLRLQLRLVLADRLGDPAVEAVEIEIDHRRHVRFAPNNGHSSAWLKRPLSATSRHES
jgi:hypothetical protein